MGDRKKGFFLGQKFRSRKGEKEVVLSKWERLHHARTELRGSWREKEGNRRPTGSKKPSLPSKRKRGV